MELVTGGSGFLGRALVRKLVEKGRGVRVFDRVPCARPQEGAEFARGDIRDASSVSTACSGVTTAYHLVGIVPQARAGRREMQAVNIGGTRNVMRACVERGVRRMVFVSSSEVYGRLEEVPCPETALCAPVGEYGVNKLAGELLCREAARERGIAVTILRPTTILGPRNWDGSFEKLFGQLDSGGIIPVPGRGDACWHVIHVEDAAEAVLRAAESEEAAGMTFNLAATGPVPTHLELARAMREHVGSAARIVKVNRTVATWALRALCLAGLSPLEPDQFLVGFSDYVLDVTSARSVLSWESRLDSLGAFRESYDWYRENLRRG